jgi:hypothetical protein
MKILARIFDFMASLELAVCLILALAAALGVGTVYESKYGAAVASQIVYRSWWMQVLLWLFMLNLAAVAISRLPWRKHHVGFLITHLGIIVLLLGAWVQQRRGVDGVLALAPGESSRMVRLDQNMLYVFRTVPGQAYDLVLEQPLNFDLRKASEEVSAYGLKGPEKEIKVLRYYPKAMRDVRAEDRAQGGVPALKLRLLGSRASFNDWMFLQADTGTTNEVGPAVIRFVKSKPDLSRAPAKATLYLYLDGDAKRAPKIAVARANQPFRELGRAPIGKNVALGWMDFEMVLDEYHPSAIPVATYSPLTKPVPGFDGYQVVETELAGQKLWLELGASGQVTAGDSLYYVQFARKQVDLGFDLLLKHFEVGYYEGTSRPKSYSSEVEVEGEAHTISMNEPLHHGGFTFYQASYEMDEAGQPRLSVLSVNYDPGRWIKYLGSLMITFGILSMFYFKPKYSGSHKLLKKKESTA